MDFSEKYNLIEFLAGDGVQSYRALQTNTGRDVVVHVLVGGKTPENEALLVRLRAMQPQSMAKLVEVGEHRGNMFVVTVAPPYQRLEEWLAEQDRVAASSKEFGKAGFWKRPEAGAPAVPAAPPRPAPDVTPGFAATAPSMQTPSAVPSSAGTGEFTRMFQGPAAPTAQPKPRPAMQPITVPHMAPPITVRADAEGVQPQDVYNRYHASFLELFQKAGLTYDLFTSTHTDNHFKEPLPRYPQVEEDEPPFRLLCTEYPKI